MATASSWPGSQSSQIGIIVVRGKVVVRGRVMSYGFGNMGFRGERWIRVWRVWGNRGDRGEKNGSMGYGSRDWMRVVRGKMRSL